MKQRRTDKEIVQPRAIETREKLLKSALELYTEKGYHKTTVDEIAKSAGLSTGVAYRYFKNKKDLLLAAITYGFTTIKEIAGVEETDLFGTDLEHTLTAFEKIHTDYFAFHEELEGLRHSDSDVGKLYDEFTKTAIENVFDKLPESIKRKPGSLENLYIAIGVMENYCHTFMYKRLSDKQLKVMRKKAIETVEYILKGDD
ncbi:MAG: TetR/AcrR family transcriptional regulator [Eubacterium sp.]|nr:TetR/AcrR family transcriptional regulator [Eubacterium sp.]